MQKEVIHLPWISVTLVLIAVALVGFFFQPSDGISGALVYRDYGYGGYGGSSGYYGGSSFFGYGMDVTSFYEQYHVWIDAIIFLAIFLSIGKAVFMSHFNTGGKALYIAVGVALTIGLMIWEEQRNFFIIYKLGPVGMFVFALALTVGTYLAMEKATGKKTWGTIGVVLLWFLLYGLFSDFLGPIWYTIGDLFAPFATGGNYDTGGIIGRLIFLAIVVVALYKGIAFFLGKEK